MALVSTIHFEIGISMKAPSNSDNESQRIATLQASGILDSPSEERFDRITRLAQRLFDVPIALVSFVDSNRQWFKSCIGLPVSETSREISFCGHAILEAGVFVVENALLDERFADNPLVTDDPFIRFYAGAPLSVGNSLSLGTLCIIDRRPREFSEDDKRALRDLADTVESELNAVEMSVLDELTGLLNRRGFYTVASHQVEVTRRNSSPLTMVYFDLNNFKNINDNFGHEQGDQVLRDFAKLLENTLRQSDILARIGGDEFVALMTNSTPDGNLRLLDDFRDLMSDYNAASKQGYTVGYASGLVEFDPDKHTTIDLLLTDADQRMYSDKKSRR